MKKTPGLRLKKAGSNRLRSEYVFDYSAARRNRFASKMSRPARKRNLFAEVSAGFAELAEAREGKRSLKTHTVVYMPAPKLSPRALASVRARLKMSRAVFAAYLRTNVRTLENWEQGRATPNAQAALLISLVKRYPDTIERLAAV
jgi:putative transcriptional regulator